MTAQKQHDNFFILTGCSGGGKSTLLAALREKGMLCVEESGRDIVRQQDMIGGMAVPWKDCGALGELILSHNMHNFERMEEETRPVLFDRGIPEAIGGDHLLGRAPLAHHVRAAQVYRYNKTVFSVPPWPEIYRTDAERKHGFEEAIREFDIQCRVYAECGYDLVEVPKTDVGTRARFVLEKIQRQEASACA